MSAFTLHSLTGKVFSSSWPIYQSKPGSIGCLIKSSYVQFQPHHSRMTHSVQTRLFKFLVESYRYLMFFTIYVIPPSFRPTFWFKWLISWVNHHTHFIRLTGSDMTSSTLWQTLVKYFYITQLPESDSLLQLLSSSAKCQTPAALSHNCHL